MKNDLMQSLHDMAEKISFDLDDATRESVAELIGGDFPPDAILAAAADWVLSMARGYARARAAQAEHEATKAREAERWQKLDQEREARRVQDRKEWIDQGRDIGDRGFYHLTDTNGHIGAKAPGSISIDNSCASCERCRWAHDREEMRRQEYYQKMAKATAKYEAEIREELFTEWAALLAIEIAMPDGSRTTWGLATIDQHRLRHEMLAKNAQANMINAARHSEAIELLERTGALNLTAAVGL